jgi:hypothetical protein
MAEPYSSRPGQLRRGHQHLENPRRRREAQIRRCGDERHHGFGRSGHHPWSVANRSVRNHGDRSPNDRSPNVVSGPNQGGRNHGENRRDRVRLSMHHVIRYRSRHETTVGTIHEHRHEMDVRRYLVERRERGIRRRRNYGRRPQTHRHARSHWTQRSDVRRHASQLHGCRPRVRWRADYRSHGWPNCGRQRNDPRSRGHQNHDHRSHDHRSHDHRSHDQVPSKTPVQRRRRRLGPFLREVILPPGCRQLGRLRPGWVGGIPPNDLWRWRPSRVPYCLHPESRGTTPCRWLIQKMNKARPDNPDGLRLSCVRRRPTLPRSGPRSTIGAERLSFRVRDGTGRFPLAMVAETLLRCGPHRRRQHKPTGRGPYLRNCTVDA